MSRPIATRMAAHLQEGPSLRPRKETDGWHSDDPGAMTTSRRSAQHPATGSPSRRRRIPESSAERAPAILPPETAIARALERFPAAVPVFLRHQMACPGCPMAPFDTLRDAARAYNLVEESFLAEIRLAIDPKERTR